jgi:hypothetical protein
MAVNFTSLFTRLGRIGHINYVANVHQAALPSAFDSLFDQFTSQPDRDWVLDLMNGYDPLLLTPIAGLDTGTLDAQRILFEMIKADNPAAATSVPAAVQELIRQMVVAAESVATCMTSVTPAVLGSMVGTGAIVMSKYRGDGLIRQNVIAEVAGVVCEVDSYSGGATAGQEQFRFTGAAQGDNRLSYDWPQGSGASFPFLAINAAAAPDNNGNLLTNSDFETYTVANTPDNWVIEAGTAGTQILKDTSAPYYGAANVRFVGNATGAAISQTFSDTTGLTGTTTTPLPEVNLALSFWGKITTAPAAGVLTIQLTDASNTVINDTQGTPNTYTLTLSTAATSWTNYTANFRFPRAVVSGCKLRVRLSTPLSVGSTLDLDHLSLATMETPYPGGPSVAVFGGAVPFARGDTWTATVANNRAGASYLATWNGFMDRLFELRDNGLQLPYSGSPTQADSLIST